MQLLPPGLCPESRRWLKAGSAGSAGLVTSQPTRPLSFPERAKRIQAPLLFAL